MIKIDKVKVVGISCCVPQEIAHNKDVLGYDQERIEKIITSTGVSKKRISPLGCCSSDLCFEAAIDLLKKTNIKKEDVGVLIFVSQTPDYRLPASACVLQNRLGLGLDTIAFDVNLGCSGYVYGLYLLSNILSRFPQKKYGLLLVGDTSTDYCSEKDASTVFLFGDAGSATLLETNDNAGNIHFSLGTDGSGYQNLIVPAGAFRQPCTEDTKTEIKDEAGNLRNAEHLFMDGMEIFNFAISVVVPHVAQVIEGHPDYSTVIFHQANKYMLEFMRKSLKIDKSMFLYSLSEYGNTSSASIPLTLCYNKQNVQDLSEVIMTGFGVGYSWGTAVADLTGTLLNDIIEWRI